MILKSGRMDAEYSAKILGSVDPMAVKHTVEDEHAEERTHPAYLSLSEQWEKQVQAIQRLRVGEAFVRLADDSVHKLRTRTLPSAHVTARLGQVRRTYLERYFAPMAATDPAPVAAVAPAPPIITRLPGRAT